ncbi:MAG: nuclease-related domain-containing protein [Pseudonocardia sp.]
MTLPGRGPRRSEHDSEGAWTDLTANAAGIGVTHEAARRRQTEGAGADRSWRVGADGEVAVGQRLGELLAVRWWDRVRRRGPQWRVLHSVELGDGRGAVRGDIDHVLIGPPGVITINTKHHRRGRVIVDGDDVTVNGRQTTYVAKARREARRARALLTTTLTRHDHPTLAATLTVSPILAVVGATVHTRRWPTGVTIVPAARLIHTLRSMTTRLAPTDIDAVFDLALRSTTWNPPAT